MDIYKVTYANLPEYSAASATAPLTGKLYPLNTLVNVVREQQNTATMVWLQLDNGNWIPRLFNGKVRAVFVEHVTDPTPPPPSNLVPFRLEVDGFEPYVGSLKKL